MKDVQKYRKRAQRLEQRSDTTLSKKVKEFLKGKKCSKVLKKRLLFCEVLKNQIKKNFTKEKSLQKKRHLAQAISGAVIKKYKIYS